LPEERRGFGKFDPHGNSSVLGFANRHNLAWQFFGSLGINDRDGILSQNGGFQHHQATVCIDGDRVGDLFEFYAPHEHRHCDLNALRPADWRNGNP